MLCSLSLLRQAAIKEPIRKEAMTWRDKKRGGLMRNKKFKSPLVMLTVLFLAHYLVPQAQAGLIVAKGVRGELPGAAAPAVELGEIPPENFDPEVGAEWISLLRSTVGGEGEGVIGPITPKGCKDKRSTGGVVCGYLSLSRAAQVGGAEGLATLALYEADDNAVPIPGTLVLFGLGLASLGASRRRR
jgi:hypothetical protein